VVSGLDAHRRIAGEAAAVFPLRHCLPSSAGNTPRRTNTRNSRRRRCACAGAMALAPIPVAAVTQTTPPVRAASNTPSIATQ
jgi:hypothetical protein